jgi:hypothetical protein
MNRFCIVAFFTAAVCAWSAPKLPDGAVLWLDAVDLKAGAVSLWADKSGRGNHLLQKSATHQPSAVVGAFNKNTGLRFFGNDFLQLNSLKGFAKGDQAFHVFIVMRAKMEKASPNPRLIDFYSGEEKRCGFWVGNQGNGRNRLGIAHGDEGQGRAVTWDGRTHVLEMIYHGGQRWELLVDGEQDGGGVYGNRKFGGFAGPVNVTLGQHFNYRGVNTYYRGDLVEVLLYNHVLTVAKQNSVGVYLSRKYEIKTAYGPLPRFEKDVRPILAQRCHKCHGGGKQEGELDLRTVSAMLKGGANGSVLTRGHAERSHFLQMVVSGKMPPKGEKPLAKDEVALLRRWVDLGAPADERIVLPSPADSYREEHRRHWAFQKPAQAQPPDIRQRGQPRTPIDAFVLKRLEADGVSFAPRAKPETLARRTWFDLTGLPPTPDELDAFLADPSPKAFEGVVDRLLDSPAYGQRWARHWLDVVRYADYHDADPDKRTASCEPTEAWRYRDWVVDALNNDLPFDQFIVHQIAGDLLPNPQGGEIYPAGLIATTFLSNGVWDRGDADKEKIVSDMADDQIDTIGKAFLGLTLGCARCHDHKFDPVSQEDYYALAGIFYSSHILQNLGTKGGEYTLNRVPLALSGKPPLAMAVQEGGTPGGLFPGIQDVPIHIRGSYTRLGRVIPRRLPQFFAGYSQPAITKGSGRHELARWVASKENPLTARVIVNRVWQWHFGEGLVRTPNNFGMRSEPPTHPELLDWLAVQFVRDGWSLKKLHREIVLSNTYQQASRIPRERRDRDPGNRRLGHFTPRRLEAEAIRDAMLFVAGRLDTSSGGPAGVDSTTQRRSLYVQTARWNRSNYALLFDAANPDASTAKRDVSTVAPQALFLLNNEFVIAQSRHLAKRSLREVPKDETARIQQVYRRLFSRPANTEEINIARQFLAQAEQRDSVTAWADLAHVLLCSNEFVYLD